jgi:hypothetical protein
MKAGRRLFVMLLALVLSCTTVALAQTQGKKEEGSGGKAGASGTVSFTITQAGFLVSASGGEGVLTFKKKSYPFRIGGLGIGGVGALRAQAKGTVHHLARIEDFPGTYVQGRAGYALGEGKGTLWLQNTNGVVLKLRSTTKGAALSLGADGLRVEMGKIKKTAKTKE